MAPTQPWDDPHDIAAAIRRIVSGKASGLVIRDEAMGTSYSGFDRVDACSVRVLDEALGAHRVISVRDLRAMFDAGEAFIAGGRGEARYEAALASTTSTSNPFGSRSAVIATARRVADERGEPLDERTIEALSGIAEAELLEAVMRYVSEPDYALDSDLPLQLSPLN